MAVRDSRGGDGESGSLPSVLPADVPYLSRMSWELGTRIVDDDESSRLAGFEHASEHWHVSFFEVTSNTVVIRVRTPVGRERFYGAVRSAVESVVPEMEATPSWRRVE